jgi:hypothetical protein
MNEMHNLLWGLSDLTDADIAAQNLEGVTLRSYLARRGVKETMIEMACAGYANTVAGTVDNVGVRNAVRMDRTWWQDGGHDMSLLPSVSRVRAVAWWTTLYHLALPHRGHNHGATIDPAPHPHNTVPFV